MGGLCEEVGMWEVSVRSLACGRSSERRWGCGRCLCEEVGMWEVSLRGGGDVGGL